MSPGGIHKRFLRERFRDPLALTIYDDEHSEHQERWVTVGRAENGQYLVVVHTSEWLDTTVIEVRIVSVRKADRQEIRDYEATPR